MSNRPGSNSQVEDAGSTAAIRNPRLWFQVTASGIAWFGVGLANMVIMWRACVHEEQYGGPSTHPGAQVLFIVMWATSFGLALLAGTLSYRSWRKLSGGTELIHAEGIERKEFMALAGMFISLTLGVGFIWMSLPLLLIQMCARTR